VIPDSKLVAATPRRKRVDAQRNVDSVLGAAKSIFATSGVDAPAKEIAGLAGVGVGTVYRHFPRRSDLVKAVLEREIDDCADAAIAASRSDQPGQALADWLVRYTEFIATKRGFAAALHSGDPAFDELPGYFWERFGPALDALVAASHERGEIRDGVRGEDLLHAVAHLCHPPPGAGLDYSQRMVGLLIAGLRAPTAPPG
jgi:AcrR family transcriptional regulator